MVADASCFFCSLMVITVSLPVAAATSEVADANPLATVQVDPTAKPIAKGVQAEFSFEIACDPTTVYKYLINGVFDEKIPPSNVTGTSYYNYDSFPVCNGSPQNVSLRCLLRGLWLTKRDLRLSLALSLSVM